MISRSLLYGSEVAAILLPTIKNLSFFRKFDPFLHTEATAFLCFVCFCALFCFLPIPSERNC